MSMKLRKNEVLLLKSLPSNLRAHGDFQWPESGPVDAPDWDPKPECGAGLHAFLWGQGDGRLVCWDADAKWLLLKAAAQDVVYLGGKVKVPKCEVVFCGDRHSAVALLKKYAPAGTVIIGSTNTGGDSSTNTGGDSSINTGEDYSTNTGGNHSINTGGDSSTNTGGNHSINTGGDHSTNTGGYHSTNTGGTGSINTGGDRSMFRGGDGSVFMCVFWEKNRRRVATAIVGEDGIEPNITYTYDKESNTWKKAKQ